MARLYACPADWPDAPYSFTAEAVIPMPAGELFDMLVLPDDWPHWFPTVRGGKLTSPLPLQQGSSREVYTPIGRMHEVFHVYEPGVRWAFYVDETTLPVWKRFMEDYEFEDLGDGNTRLRWTIRYEPTLWLKPILPIFRRVFPRTFHQGVVDLAAYVTRRNA